MVLNFKQFRYFRYFLTFAKKGLFIVNGKNLSISGPRS